MSARRKYSAISGIEDSRNAFLSQRDKNPRYVSTVPSDLINVTRDIHDEFAILQNDPLRKSSNIESEVDYCGFSYYRSNRTGFQDAVLVKDIGVSCNLLNKSTVEPDISISGVESYLIKQLKLEYNELSNIIKKLNAYTKDILNNLASRCKRKDQILQKLNVASKYVMATQCTDEVGNPCLKLRFRDNTERKCTSSNIDLNKNSIKEENIREKMHKNSNTKKRCTEFDKAFAKGFLEVSSKCSGVLLRNYLITKREKVSSNTLKVYLRKTENFLPSGKLCENRAADKSCECFYTSKCSPSVFTNWQEISRRKICKSKSCIPPINTSDQPRA